MTHWHGSWFRWRIGASIGWSNQPKWYPSTSLAREAPRGILAEIQSSLSPLWVEVDFNNKLFKVAQYCGLNLKLPSLPHLRMVAVWLWKLQNKGKLLALLDQHLPAEDARMLRTFARVTHAKGVKNTFTRASLQDQLGVARDVSKDLWRQTFHS